MACIPSAVVIVEKGTVLCFLLPSSIGTSVDTFETLAVPPADNSPVNEQKLVVDWGYGYVEKILDLNITSMNPKYF